MGDSFSTAGLLVSTQGAQGVFKSTSRITAKALPAVRVTAAASKKQRTQARHPSSRSHVCGALQPPRRLEGQGAGLLAAKAAPPPPLAHRRCLLAGQGTRLRLPAPRDRNTTPCLGCTSLPTRWPRQACTQATVEWLWCGTRLAAAALERTAGHGSLSASLHP